MDDAERARLSLRARDLIAEIVGAERITEALAWGEAAGHDEVNALLREHREDLWLAWQDFSLAGSPVIAALVFRAFEPPLRRLFIALVLTTFAVSFRGDVMRFLDPGGPELAVPDWFLALIA